MTSLPGYSLQFLILFMHHKDFALVREMAEEQHLPMPAQALVYAQLSKLMEAGWGTMDTCNLLRVLEADVDVETDAHSPQ